MDRRESTETDSFVNIFPKKSASESALVLTLEVTTASALSRSVDSVLLPGGDVVV